MNRRQLFARVTVPMRSILEHRLIDLIDEQRLQQAGVPAKQAGKALERARASRWYRRVMRPELQALTADLARQHRAFVAG